MFSYKREEKKHLCNLLAFQFSVVNLLNIGRKKINMEATKKMINVHYLEMESIFEK